MTLADAFDIALQWLQDADIDRAPAPPEHTEEPEPIEGLA